MKTITTGWIVVLLVLTLPSVVCGQPTSTQPTMSKTEDETDAWYTKGRAFQKQGKLDEALAAYRKGVEIDPSDTHVWCLISWVLGEQGKLDEAFDAYQQGLETRPQTGEAEEELRLFRIKFRGRLGHGHLGDNALLHYHTLLPLVHHDAEHFLDLLKGFLEGFMRRGMFEDALVAYHDIKRIEPDYAWRLDLWRDIGKEFWEQGEFDRAAKAFEQELLVQPENAFLLCEDVELALQQGDMARVDTRIVAAQALVGPENALFAMLPFYVWLARPEQGWSNSLSAITQLHPEVTFPKVSVTRVYYETGKVTDVEYTWNPSGIAPVINKLAPETQAIAKRFIAFFEGKIDRETLMSEVTKFQ